MAAQSIKVKLYFKGEGLADKDLFSKSDPYLILYKARDDITDARRAKMTMIGRTETIKNNLNPLFKTGIEVDYLFQQRQSLVMLLYDDDGKGPEKGDDYLGGVVFQLSQVVGNHGAIATLHLPRGKVYVSAVAIYSHIRDQVELQFSGTKLKKMDLFGKSDPFFHLCRKTPHGSLDILYKSTIIYKTLNPNWPAFKLPVNKMLGASSADKVLTFQCFDKDKRGADSMGEFTCSFDELAAAASLGQTFTLVHPQKRKKTYGTIHVNRHQIHRITPFLDLLRGGLQLNLAVSIDFTGSNGNPVRHTSLHYMSGQQPNEYIQAMTAVGNIVVPYDADGQISAFGFGAKLQGHPTSHFFPITFGQCSYVAGLDGLLKAYASALTKVQLSGPTNFKPTIEAVTEGSRQGSNTYTILLIITDGEITDMDDTVDAIVAADDAPLSIIIVGVGRACSFRAMERLDADDEPLRSRNGRTSRRDIVQFVPFRQFEKGPPETLAAEVLRELPKQVEDWAALVEFGAGQQPVQPQGPWG